MYFSLDFQNVVILISLGIHLLLLFVLFRARKSPGGMALGAIVYSVAAWVLAMVLYRARVFGTVEIWVRLLYVMATLIPTSFFHFTLVFPENKKISLKKQFILLIETLAIISLCFHPNLFIKGVQLVPGEEAIILWGPLYLVYALHITGVFSLGFLVLYNKIKKASGIVRVQMVNVLLGSLVSSSLAVVTNLILPWFGYFGLNWIGQFFSTLFAAFTSYSILKHNLLYIRLYTTEGFILVLNLVLFVQFLFSDAPGKFAINGIILASVLLASGLLLRSVRIEIQRKEELAKLAESLSIANNRLQELDKQKTDFLSIAAHQLRTPLSIFNGYLELLQDNAYGKISKEAKEVLTNMDESNGHLVKLVDSFLDITRLEQGRTKYDFKETDFNDIVRDVIKEFVDRARQKGLTIKWSPVLELPKAILDSEKIRHVVFNFVDNAIKYSETGEINVQAYKDKDGIAFKVKDNGLGFEKIDEANFFQKFYRGNNVQGINVNGTGLGLYVCRMFIEAHRGKVWAHSEGMHKGGEFGFWIPLINSPQQTTNLPIATTA